MKKANKLKAKSLILIASSVASFVVFSVNYYFSVRHESLTAKYITLGNRRISILKSGSGRVYKIEEVLDNAPCLLPGCAGWRDDMLTAKLRNEMVSQNSTRHSLQPIEKPTEANPLPCTGMGQDCSNLHLESLNALKSIPLLSGFNPPRPTAGKTNTSFSDKSSSTAGEICYHYTEAGRCALAPCPGQQVARTHYRGLVREVQHPGPAHPNRTFGACVMCSIYARQCMVSVAHRFAAPLESEQQQARGEAERGPRPRPETGCEGEGEGEGEGPGNSAWRLGGSWAGVGSGQGLITGW